MSIFVSQKTCVISSYTFKGEAKDIMQSIDEAAS
jgi:hypothetical protein